MQHEGAKAYTDYHLVAPVVSTKEGADSLTKQYPAKVDEFDQLYPVYPGIKVNTTSRPYMSLARDSIELMPSYRFSSEGTNESTFLTTSITRADAILTNTDDVSLPVPSLETNDEAEFVNGENIALEHLNIGDITTGSEEDPATCSELKKNVEQ